MLVSFFRRYLHKYARLAGDQMRVLDSSEIHPQPLCGRRFQL